MLINLDSITISQRNSINDSALMKKAAAENMEDSLESKLKKLDEELALHQSMLVKRGSVLFCDTIVNINRMLG